VIAMKRTLRLAIPIMLFAFFAAFVRAQNAAMPEEKAVIAGTVLDAVSQRPLKGADVRLRSLPTDTGTASVSRPGPTSTDADGRFVFNGVTPGRYVVMVSRDGYVNNRGDNFRLRGELLSVAPGQHVNDIVVRLLPDGAIAGHVTNEAGKPLRDVSVLAMKSSYPHGRRELQDVAHAVTNDAGEYRIESLAPGKYYIRTKPPASLKAKPGSEKAYVPIYYPAASDQAHSVALVLRAGEELVGIDMALIPVHTVHIRGTVINGRTLLPSKEAEVTLLSDQGETVFLPGKSFSDGGQANFDFPSIPPGSYVLVAQQSGSVREPKTMWGRTSIEVKDSNLDHVEVVVGPGVDVGGRIRVEEDGAADSTKQVHYESIQGILELQEPSSLAALTPDIDTTTVNADGNFIFHEVPEGSYRIRFVPVPDSFYLKSLGADALETGIIVGRSHSPDAVELVLSAGAGRVEGSVESDDQSFPGASVVLVPDGKDRGQPSDYQRAVTDQLGRFAMRNVVPGDYTIFAWEQIDRGAYFDPEFLARYEDRGKAVHVEEGGQVSVKLDLIPAAEAVP
jgi:Carboxypeptidase regulatory-like domain